MANGSGASIGCNQLGGVQFRLEAQIPVAESQVPGTQGDSEPTRTWWESI
jgi:hypothetical protein